PAAGHRPARRRTPNAEEPTMSTNEQLIAPDGANDPEAILSGRNTAGAILPGDEGKGARPALNRLYEKAKGAQWNGETDLPWDTEVDQVAVVLNNMMNMGGIAGFAAEPEALAGTPFERFGPQEWLQVGIETQIEKLSRFLHGEQGALLCTAKIVETVPWIDAKYYAATQVMDEARHV